MTAVDQHEAILKFGLWDLRKASDNTVKLCTVKLNVAVTATGCVAKVSKVILETFLMHLPFDELTASSPQHLKYVHQLNSCMTVASFMTEQRYFNSGAKRFISQGLVYHHLRTLHPNPSEECYIAEIWAQDFEQQIKGN
ncbi:hypothetical protein AVEN_243224-1 [Araneus ventricosus]|uniref:Uncharacterized protein n=1 Tax=Araneus ventricosus TaxID=182803 RepID=A0A4Y2IST6_ARAVE|nr:hypothetical protein AVEN_243224-1 [Araneus ventricosus]